MRKFHPDPLVSASRLETGLARCPHCGGRLRLIATLHDPAVLRPLPEGGNVAYGQPAFRALGGDGPGHSAGGDAEWSVQHEAGIFPWEGFRRELIAQAARAEAAGGPFEYYETWLAAFEGALAEKGLLRADEVEESAHAFEYGERDDVY